ncbi:hypothetical protein JYU02_00155 [bacterium AH-315-P15]|nr:hypothetical protein [bacterium AH-315-P15]
MVDQLFDVCEGVGGEGLWPYHIIILAGAVHALAPDPDDEITRAGLVHVALRRSLCAPQCAISDCLGEAMQKAKAHRASCECCVSTEFARVLSLAFAAHAGDLADPARGADIVLPHDLEKPHIQGIRPVALLGGFLFFKTSPPI